MNKINLIIKIILIVLSYPASLTLTFLLFWLIKIIDLLIESNIETNWVVRNGMVLLPFGLTIYLLIQIIKWKKFPLKK